MGRKKKIVDDIEKEIMLLYPTTSVKDIAKKTGATPRHIRTIASIFKLRRIDTEWTDQQNEFLLANYKKIPEWELTYKLKRSIFACQKQYGRLTTTKTK